MRKEWKDWALFMIGLIVFLLVPPRVAAVQATCNVSNPHWDCYSESEGYCPDHCPAGVPGCF